MGSENKSDPKARIQQIVRQFSGSLTEEDTCDLIPEYVIKGEGHIFCFYPSKKMMVRIMRGTKAFIVDETVNGAGRLLIYTFNGDLVEIEPDELQYTGFD